MKIGIFGGSFDPVHIGHLISAVEVRHLLNLNEIIFMPAQQSPHKDVPAKKSDRLNMLKRSIEPYEFLSIDTYELERKEISYTYNTVMYLTERYPNDELYFLIGTDQYEKFDQWYKYKELLNMIRFVVMKRMGKDVHIKEPFIEAVQPMIEVSSSLVRTRIQKQEEYRHLLPEGVSGYIKEKKLYEA